MATTMSQAEINAMVAENERLKELLARKTTLGLKVGSRGTVSLSGINGPRPVSLYADQWIRVLEFGSVIEQFIDDNDHLLARKSDSATEAAAKQAARDAAGILRPEAAAAAYEARQSGGTAAQPAVQGSASSRRPSRVTRKA